MARQLNPTADELALFDRRALHAHDLPPKWDGLEVQSQGWEQPVPVFMCPPPRTADKCQSCGSTQPAQTNRGIVHVAYSAHLRPIRRDPQLRSIPLHTLTASRCPECFLDTVTDCADTEARLWVLDASDYGDDG